MDISSFTTAASALKAAKDIGAALIELRDFNQVAATTSKLNSELLKAQESLFTAQSKMLELQSEHLEVLNKLREFEKSAQQRARYELIELGQGVFAYRLKGSEHRQEEIAAQGDEPIHHLCQPCLDIRHDKSVLRRGNDGWGNIMLDCPVCGQRFGAGEHIPIGRGDFMS